MRHKPRLEVKKSPDAGGLPFRAAQERLLNMTLQRVFSLHAAFNYGEAALWGLIAVVLLWRCRLPGGWRWLLPLAFAVFAVTDLIEIQTGAWNDPWWLGVLKAACVLVFLLAWRVHRRQGSGHG